MGLMVIDSSAIVAMLIADDGSRRSAVVARLSRGDTVYAPSHLDMGVAVALRGVVRRERHLIDAVPALLRDFYDLPIRRERLSADAYAGLAIARRHDRL